MREKYKKLFKFFATVIKPPTLQKLPSTAKKIARRSLQLNKITVIIIVFDHSRHIM